MLRSFLSEREDDYEEWLHYGTPAPHPSQRLTDVLAGGPHVDTEAPAKWQALPDWVSSPFYSWNVSEFLSVNKPCSKTS